MPSALSLPFVRGALVFGFYTSRGEFFDERWRGEETY